MPKNPVVQLVICLVLAAWLLVQLFAPGEAQNQTVVIMEWAALVGILLGIVTAVVRLAARR